MAKSELKILVGYVHYQSPYSNVGQEAREYFKRLSDAGFDVEGFCLTLNPPGPCLSFAEMDARWHRGDRELLIMYERLEERLSDKDVFINESGINLHPKFVENLNVFTVFQCFDDIDGLNENLTKPAAYAYDLCLTGNVAEVNTYRRAGLVNVEWIPLGLRHNAYDRELTYEKVLTGQRDIDLFMLIDRFAPWGNRLERLNKLATAFPDAHFYGKGWTRGFLPREQEINFLTRAKIGPNIHLATGPLNYRTYYLPANGVMQICDNKSHLSKVYELGKEVVGFDTVEECIDLCRYYLAHDEERRQIAAGGWRRATTDYNEVAVFSRTVRIIEEYMSRRAQRPIGANIAVRQRHSTRRQRIIHSMKTAVKILIPSPIAHQILSSPLLAFSSSFKSRISLVGKHTLSYVSTKTGILKIRRQLKLHLGCGTEHLDGYVNIDNNPHAAADLYMDFLQLQRIFAPESVAEVVMIHSLSYLNLWQARDLFRQLYQLLEPHGKLVIELPDCTKCARRILEAGQSDTDYLEAVRGFYAFDLEQINRREAYKPYAFGWSSWHLKKELEDAGFGDVTLLAPQTHGPRPWRDIRVEAKKK